MFALLAAIIGYFVGAISVILILGLCRASGRAELEYKIAEIIIDLKNALKELDDDDENKDKALECR